MTANAGYHAFSTGDVLTAAQVQYNLQNQTIMYFASSAARSAALGAAVVEGMFSYLADTDSTEYYNGSAWTSISNPGDITAVTAGTGISGGGTSGAVTVTNSMATAITTNGDLIYGTGSGTFNRLGIGSSAQVLTVSGGVPSWATPASSSSGVTLITSSSFTSATSHSLNNCFSATYKNYKVIVTFTGGTGSPELSYKLRVGGTDNSASYSTTRIYAFGTTIGAVNNSSGTDEFDLGGIGVTQYTSIITDINTPFASQPTTFHNRLILGTGLIYQVVSAGFHDNGGSFDGLTLIASTGNLTGTIYVYGMAI